MDSKGMNSIWIRGLHQGDVKAFRQIFDHYYPRLLKFCAHIFHSQLEAEEVVQDIMVKLWQIRAQVDASQSLDSFLFTLARNKAYDRLRKISADRKLREKLWYQMQKQVGDAESSLIWKDYQLLTEQAVAILPPQRQKIFRMSREEGLTHEEIATCLNLSPKTVNNHLTLALQSIRQYLAPHVDIALLLFFFLEQFLAV